jgi:hypothetical protein
MGWRKPRQRKWTKDKEKGRSTKKRETGKEAQERRYESKGRSTILERGVIK